MRILITGGFGFLGGRLASHFSKNGIHQVVIGSRNGGDSPSWLPEVEVIRTDWTSTDSLTEVCDGIDLIIHSAGMNANDCAKDPVAALDFNGVATARLVSAARRANVRLFIYISTIHVYSNHLTGSINEKSCPRNLHPYATSHLAGEHAVLNPALTAEGMKPVVLRLSNAYGVPMHSNVNCWTLLVNDLCKQAMLSQKLVLKSSGKQERDFISLHSVTSVVEKIVGIATSTAIPSVINLGSGQSRTVLEMAEIVKNRCKEIYDFEPEIAAQQTDEIEQVSELNYSQRLLNSLSIKINDENNYEIDNLLRYCKFE